MYVEEALGHYAAAVQRAAQPSIMASVITRLEWWRSASRSPKQTRILRLFARSLGRSVVVVVIVKRSCRRVYRAKSLWQWFQRPLLCLLAYTRHRACVVHIRAPFGVLQFGFFGTEHKICLSPILLEVQCNKSLYLWLKCFPALIKG